VVQSALFPHLHQGSIVNPPPAKRRKITETRETPADDDLEMDSTDEPLRGVVLESSKETYLVTRSKHEGKERYTLSVFEPPSSDVSQPCSSTPSIRPADPPSKIQDSPTSPIPEPSEERKTPTDDLLLNGSATDPPDSETPPDAPPKAKETDASSKPSSAFSPSASPKPSVRVLRSRLSEDDFSFENDTIVISTGSRRLEDDGDMVVDDDEQHDALKMRVLRWRWHSGP